jgi:hypothetical protein
MRRYKVKCKDSREVVVGDLVMDTSISARALEVVTVHCKDVVVVLKRQDNGRKEKFYVEKKRLVFWDSKIQDKLRCLNDKRGDLSERIREIDQIMRNIEELFVGCE